MAITTGSLVEVSLNMELYGQRIMNVWQYRADPVLGSPSAAEIGAAWWGAVKTPYRALCNSGFGSVFRSVRVRELNDPTGAYGEHAIVSGEQAGTRTVAAEGQIVTTFVAAGVRLAVESRTTRPGQKRFPFITESDLNSNEIGSAFQALVVTLMNTMASSITLGSPAVGTVLLPIVVRKDATGAVTANQEVTGYVINTNATSQVSRRFGRGS